MKRMIGERQVDQAALFYEFSLERHVPAEHMLRAIDGFVDLEGVRAHLVTFYSPTGRPSVPPELLIRMLIVGYCFGIRSERQLCQEVHLTLPIAGSVDWASMAMCRTIQPSPRTVTAASATAIYFGTCSRPCCDVVWLRGWWAERVLLSMRVLSKPMRTGRAGCSTLKH